MADITVRSVGAQIDADTYQVTWTTQAADDMPEEIFVFKYATRRFDHVANGSDLQFPTSPTAGQAWYRQSSGVATYGSVGEANAAIANVASDIQALVDDFNADLTTFTTPVVTNYT